ncbi:hypothetical protein RSOL_267430 [Rhizoctonia solani AG-3 Rhs1AP]|uniref:Uncharacterized protein n=1 Tax=Rhizoctonia solani AG-3 Rhs1AP TaxID=1086054 RepID=A0A0A1UK45_9AGAM|nr:hypothetical protein RSOL_267430 [Rhizoctonia solani AG-3 Rhs1AP]
MEPGGSDWVLHPCTCIDSRRTPLHATPAC